jgi:hypothetical protein
VVASCCSSAHLLSFYALITRWHKSECGKEEFLSKTIILDEGWVRTMQDDDNYDDDNDGGDDDDDDNDVHDDYDDYEDDAGW